MTTSEPSASTPRRTLLGRALRANAAFSGSSGLLLVLGAARLDTWLGVDAWALVGLGAGLLGYGFALYVWARSPLWLRRGGMLAVLGDLLWVIGAVILIAFTDVLTPSGEIALAGVTAVVAVLGTVQAVGLMRLGSDT